MSESKESGWPTNLDAYIAERITAEGGERIRQRLEKAMAGYYRTVATEVPPSARPEFQLRPGCQHKIITQS